MSYYGLDQLRESMVKILNPAKGETAGSGFIIRSDGYLVTCHHVIYPLDRLIVEYQGQEYEAQWCEALSNPDVDIAILKITIENAHAVPIINPQHLSTSVTVYGFPPSQKKYFPEGINFSAPTIRPSAPVKIIPTYRIQTVTATNLWNRLPQEQSTFVSHRIDTKVDSGTSGADIVPNGEPDCPHITPLLKGGRGDQKALGESSTVNLNNVENRKIDDVIFPLFLRLSDLEEKPEEVIEAIPQLIQRDYPKNYPAIDTLLQEKCEASGAIAQIKGKGKAFNLVIGSGYDFELEEGGFCSTVIGKS
ncbi:trypsin-like peptidase domain-containing protein [Coleofasciculus sp. G2-EDA-02]|uniref:trypsin-like peptidase domain-containing protein n=1 Tax=Coleofasciculus sp. G2-EDA-02 TaxID=3069529 RepID=UPI0032FD1CB8